MIYHVINMYALKIYVLHRSTQMDIPIIPVNNQPIPNAVANMRKQPNKMPIT